MNEIYCIFLLWIFRKDTSWRKTNCFLSQNCLQKQVGDRRLFKETRMTITIIVAGFFQDIKQFAVNNALYANSDGLGIWNMGFQVLEKYLHFLQGFFYISYDFLKRNAPKVLQNFKTKIFGKRWRKAQSNSPWTYFLLF